MNRAILPMILLALAGCSRKADMVDQPKRQPLEASSAFPDGASLRHPPAHTVARTAVLSDADARPALTRSLLERGRDRFDIFCSPCHARDGYSDGIIAQHGFPAPPSFHTDQARALTDQQFFDIVSNGLGVMPPYGSQVTPEDRWAIVAFIRALQLSQNAPASAVPDGASPESAGKRGGAS